KKDIYEGIFRTPDYFIFNPFDPNSLEGWHLHLNQGYQELTPNEQGWLWCESLGLWVGTWQGTISREEATWVRFYDTEGNLVLLPDEAAQQRADTAEERANAAQQAAEAAQQAVEVVQQQVETIQQQVEAAQRAAETAQQRANRLAVRLRELGENPDDLGE
ncbi:Uma2 family endonuclease, partial [Spirulina sp. CS-785/01]